MHNSKFTVPGFLVVLLMLLLGSCDRKPSEPGEPREYVFWMAEYYDPIEGSFRYYRYYPVQDRFDTLDSPYETSHTLGPTLSATGTKLYLPNEAVGTRVVTADNMALIHTIPLYGHIAVDAKGRWIAINSQSGLHILNAHDHAVWMADSVQLFSGSFTRDGLKYFGLSSASGEDWVAEFDIHQKSLQRIIELPHGLPRKVYPIDNGRRLLLNLQYRSFEFAFAIYDVALDSFLLWHSLTPGHPQIAVTPDEHYAIVTNPGTYPIRAIQPPSSFLVFDLQTNQLREEVDTRVVQPDSVLQYGRMAAQYVAITPDGKRALVTGFHNGQLLIYNLETMTIDLYHDYSFSDGLITTDFNHVTCQTRP